MYPQQSDELKKKALEYNRKFSYYYSARQKWARRGNEYEQVFLNDVEGTGTQYTEKDLAELKRKYGIPLSINILSAIVQQVQAFLTSPQASIWVVPVGKSSKGSAYFWRELVKGITYLNKFPIKQLQALQDMLIVGHGLLFVEPDNFYDQNEFKVLIKCLPWKWVFFDPNSIERDYQDSEMMFISYPVTKSRARKLLAPFGLTEEILLQAESKIEGDTSEFMSTVPPSPLFYNDKLIWYQEIFEKVRATVYILQDGTRTMTPPEPSVNSGGELEGFSGMQYPGTFIKRTLKLGNCILHEEVLPITKYPIFPYIHTHNRNPFVYGLVHQVVDVQHAANKCIALTVENVQKGGNSAMISPAGSIEDKEKFQRERSTPGGVAEWHPDPSLPDGGAPRDLQPIRLPSAWFTLFERLIKLIEYITGVFDLMQGNPESAPETLGATQSLQSFGSQRPQMIARTLDYTNQDLLEVLIEYTQAYSPRENVLRYVDGTGAMVEIESEVSARIQQNESGESEVVPDESGPETASFVRNESTKEVLAILGAVKEGQYRVRYQSSTNLPTTRAMALGILKTALSGIDDPTLRTVLMQTMLELADYPEVDKVMRDVNAINRLNQMVQQLQGQLEEAQKTIQEKDKDIEHYMMQAKEAEIDAEVSKAKTKVDYATRSLQDDIKEVEKQKKEKVFQ